MIGLKCQGLDRLDIDHILTIEYRLERGEIGNRAELDRPIEAQRRSPTWRLHRHPDRPEACPSKPRRQLKVAVPTVLVDEQDCGTWLSSSTSLQRPGSPALQHRSSVGTTSRGSPHRGIVGRHGSDRTGRTLHPPRAPGRVRVQRTQCCTATCRRQEPARRVRSARPGVGGLRSRLPGSSHGHRPNRTRRSRR